MSGVFIFAVLALVAFGFIFRFISDEERRAFFRVMVALFLVFGLVAYFTYPLSNREEIREVLKYGSVVAFIFSVLFLLPYYKLDQKLRWGISEKRTKGSRKK